MPTPFYHISLAKDLIAHPNLPAKVRQFMLGERCAFVFGNTAPDVQVVSGQPRRATHFFDLPIQESDPPAWELMLAEYPHMRDAQALAADQAAFMAGYLCHLQADWIWITDIFAPVFGPGGSWGTFSERLYYHNVLRAYLDQQILPGIGSGMDACLSMVKPDGWLPFVGDNYLVSWRDFLASQLRPGAASQTVEVFSSRQGKSAQEYTSLLTSVLRMQHEVFVHIPLEKVESYRQKVLAENSRLLTHYLASALHQQDPLKV